ncbi:MAG TPA: D-Ala-D-Ala carboxypeptidase family metallohydrolase [Gammaproteobacteria bacterium]|nr:D-Ala-D-Ala carboxypeptidase family metallohydrolase [Gammaproteobacteria bacterium]
MSWRFFSEKEMACRCGCAKVEMNNNFMNKLIALREHLHFPLPITSGFRCAKHNSTVSKTSQSGPHTLGRAVDISICGENAFKLIQNAPSFGFTGFGISQKGPQSVRFVHIDDLTKEDGFPRPWIWGY